MEGMGFLRDLPWAKPSGNPSENPLLPNIFIKSIILQHFRGSGMSFSHPLYR